MGEIAIALLIFACLIAASIGSLLFYEYLTPAPHAEATHGVVKSVANIFVVLTSLVLGLMINSAKNTFELVDHNVHAFAINVILLDRTLRAYGPDAETPRQHLLAYVERLWDSRNEARNGPSPEAQKQSATLLAGFLDDMKRLRSTDAERTALWHEAQQLLQKIVELRWTLIEQSEGTLPMPLLALMVAWLMLIFASLGYRAPRNAIVMTTFVLSSGLIAGTIYLILDMSVPFDGPIYVSPAPLQRALAEMKR